MRKLISLGESDIEEDNWKITVTSDKEAGTLSFEDNGIGMTADEVKKYIIKLLFSSAEDFLEKFKDSEDAIIGHLVWAFIQHLGCE